jgi:hypothetical protein
LEGVPALKWETGKFPQAFLHIGTLELTPEEAALNSNTHGTLSDSTGQEVLWEWRWLHDRAALTKEFAEQQVQFLQRIRNRHHKPKAMLNDDLFWSLVALVNPLGASEEAMIGACVERLAQLPLDQIQRFEESMSYKLYQLDTREHARNIGIGAFSNKDVHFSADNFLYARCAAVASGRRCYERALKNPAAMPRNMEMEALLSIAGTAYELRSGRSMDYLTGCSYETFSNRRGWE